MAKKTSSALGYNNSENGIVVPVGAMQQQENGKPETVIGEYAVVNLGLLELLREIEKLRENGKEISSDTLPGFTMIKAKVTTREGKKAKPDKDFEIGE